MFSTIVHSYCFSPKRLTDHWLRTYKIYDKQKVRILYVKFFARFGLAIEEPSGDEKKNFVIKEEP